MYQKYIQLILLKIIIKKCLSLHYNGANSYLFVKVTDIFTAKDLKL